MSQIDTDWYESEFIPTVATARRSDHRGPPARLLQRQPPMQRLITCEAGR